MTSVFRLEAASPHFAAIDEASHPNIIMRRPSTSERTVTPASGQGTKPRPIKTSAVIAASTPPVLISQERAALRNPYQLRAALVTVRINASIR
jgi:hypothetical protein